MTDKTCIECGASLLSKKTDTCRRCRKRQGDKRYAEKHREQILAQKSRWYFANKDLIRLKNKRRRYAQLRAQMRGEHGA